MPSGTGVTPRPMLASVAGTETSVPVYVQPKLDGVRCIAIRTGPTVRLFSRTGREFPGQGHIVAALREVMPFGAVWDGELWTSGRDFQTVLDGVNADADWLEFHVFDVVADGSFRERLCRLPRPHGPVRPVATELAHDVAQVRTLFRTWVARGMEGVMLRTPSGRYRAGQRSHDLTKMKAHEDGDFPVLSVGPMTVRCRAPSGSEFALPRFVGGVFLSVSTGDVVKVRHEGWTRRGLPRHPKILGLRAEWDGPGDPGPQVALMPT